MNGDSNSVYDVIVVGGGHAGCEAALAAARLGTRTALITHRPLGIADMPCNPAIGGIAKSHLVCELDALGGEMGVNADYTGIQFRVLNTRKGPAVRATRVQSDKQRYALRMQSVLAKQSNLTVIVGSVDRILLVGDGIDGLQLTDGRTFQSSSVILTPGTFVGGTLYAGLRRWGGGRIGEPPANALGRCLREIGLQTGRLKTGTPPRLRRGSLNYEAMSLQPGIEPAPFFSWRAQRESALFHVEQCETAMRPWLPGANQVPCHLTHTTTHTHDIVRDNLKRSALYGGAIEGTGVRYCPSIEDKIVKFSDKQSHHVFVEPEGRDTDWMYPNGLSNSLPETVQLAMIHSVPGCEKAAVVRYGYAIEYEYCQPTQLSPTMEAKQIEGLYLAGQINGTTGYEEAAAQGFLAGVNAARKVKGQTAVVFGRGDGYIGVLADDLTLKGTDEPYRMFTSRAEHRLILRQDNARFRMAAFAAEIGLTDKTALRETFLWAEMIEEECRRLHGSGYENKTLAAILCRPEMNYDRLPGKREDLPFVVQEQVEIAIKYEGYIRREESCIRKSAAMDACLLPSNLNYASLRALSTEAREKLNRLRPATLGQAGRVPGVSPADIAALSVLTKGMRG